MKIFDLIKYRCFYGSLGSFEGIDVKVLAIGDQEVSMCGLDMTDYMFFLSCKARFDATGNKVLFGE